MNAKIIALIIITLLFSSFSPNVSGSQHNDGNKTEINLTDSYDVQEDVIITCYSLGVYEQSTKEIEIPYCEVEELFTKISDYSIEIARDPQSQETQQLYHEIIRIADEQILLPTYMSTEAPQISFNPFLNSRAAKITQSPILQNKASAFFCNFATTGTGSQFPIIILPRLIPILLMPIPRVFLRWTATEGITSCGGLLSGKGFIAYGQQKGLALGFWGIGFSVFLPPIMQYGFIGYALYARADAEVIELWPPNSLPTISQINPGDGEIDVSLSLSELQFHISDFDGDLMSYTVTTTPDIGSGSGNLKPDGVYSVPISGLEDLTEYSWHIEVTDGTDTIIDDFTFTTEAIAPIVSNPSPQDDERYVPVSLSHLSFHLKDFQGDPMDYTVETVPYIGSASATGVSEGTYSVPVSGLDYFIEYIWYVNATDGEHQTNKIFNFQTEHEMIFDPFTKGWQYRKEITIDHTKVDGNLVNFPVLISTTDVDLRDKAQDDGDDILFMDGTGVANRCYHEIESYDSSSGELVVWVNVADLSSDQDTVLFMYYGNPSSSNQQAPELVWDSDYEAVYHMDDLTSSTIKDATGNGYTSTETGNPVEVDAKIGKGQDYESDSKMYHSSSEIMDMNANQDMTCELWFNAESYRSHSFVGTDDGDDLYYWSIRGLDDGKLVLSLCDGSSPENNLVWDGPYALSEWYHLAAVIDRENEYQYLYINGNEEESSSIEGIGGVDNEDETWFIGHGGNLPDGGWRWDGLADEIRISNTVRDVIWISTSYNNQCNPSSFIEVGPEEFSP